MKKILALTLSGMLVFSGFVASLAANATEGAPQAEMHAEAAAAERNNLYLVPGTYTSGGNKVKNSISEGATALGDQECADIFTENAYVCTLSAGEALPRPSTQRKDKDGKDYSFNGWWMIVDATVTYFETVPEITQTTFLYADWRADLSQRKDPVIPQGGVEVEPNHYLMIKHAGESETEKVTLHKAFTNMMNAETLGYLYPVELYVEGLEMLPGDVITVYTTGLTDSDEAVISPVLNSGNTREIQLESKGDGSISTSDYLSADPGSLRRNPSLTFIAEEAGVYNLYIKYFSSGSIMAVYMEPKA